MMTTRLVSLGHQVQVLTVTVQNHARTVSEQRTEGPPSGASANQRPDPTPKSYAKAAAQAPQSATPATPAKGKRKAQVGPRPPKQPTTKLQKKTQEQQANEQPKGKNNSQKPTQTSNVAKIKLFATRITAKPLADPAGEEAKISLAMATVLTGCECKAPTNRQVFSNKTNGTITLTVRSGTDSSRFRYRADGPRKTSAPGPFPRPAPRNPLGRGLFFAIPCPCPGSGPRPTHNPDRYLLKVGGNKQGPVPGMNVGGPRTGTGRGLP